MSVKKIEFSSDQTQELFRLYETERLNTRKIAKTFNVSQSTIIRILRENNKLKTISEACKGRLVWNKDKTNVYSKEVRQKMSDARIGVSPWNSGLTSEEDPRILSGDKHPMKGKNHTPEACEIIRRSRIGTKQSKESREKISVSGIKSYQNGRNISPKTSGWGKGEWYNSRYHGTIWLRSQGEIKYATFLDEHEISWTYEQIFFKFIHKNKRTTYRPDFYLIDYDIYIDVKGYLSEESAQKIKSFREQYPQIHLDLLFYNDLRNFGINI